MDDAAEFATVRHALADVGISPEAQTSLFATLSGVLWLGNVDFSPHHDDDDSTIVRYCSCLTPPNRPAFDPLSRVSRDALECPRVLHAFCRQFFLPNLGFCNSVISRPYNTMM